MRWVRRLGSNRLALRTLYYLWVAFPLPLRKPLTAAALLGILGMKKVTGVNRDNEPTPMESLGIRSFWGVPAIDVEQYVLEVGGEADRPLRFTHGELLELDAVVRPVRMDCVGGFRNNSTMKGVPLAVLFKAAEVTPRAESAVFHCADSYYTAHRVSELLDNDAFLAYEINGQRINKFGYPLRLVAPGTYGYKWAKWVVSIQLVRGWPKGYWEEKGLPKRGKVGDVW